MFFFFNQKTAYEMLIIDWSSDVCSSDLEVGEDLRLAQGLGGAVGGVAAPCLDRRHVAPERDRDVFARGAQTLEPLDRQKPVHLLQRRSQTGSEVEIARALAGLHGDLDRKSTRLNSSH